MINNDKNNNKTVTAASIPPPVQFKNLKTDKQKIDFVKDKIREYFVPFEDAVYISKDKWGKWVFRGFCSWEGFRVKYDISKSYFDENIKNSPNFIEEVAYATDIIKDIVVKGGLSGGFNPKFTQLAAQNLIGWTAKSETKETGRGNQSPIAVIVLEAEKRGVSIDTTAKELTKSTKLVKLTKKASIVYNKGRDKPSTDR